MLRHACLTLPVLSLLLISFGAARGEAACRDLHVARGLTPVAYSAEAVIQYFGHNFFQITTRQGTQIVTDPLAPSRCSDTFPHTPCGHGRQGTPQS